MPLSLEAKVCAQTLDISQRRRNGWSRRGGPSLIRLYNEKTTLHLARISTVMTEVSLGDLTSRSTTRLLAVGVQWRSRISLLRIFGTWTFGHRRHYHIICRQGGLSLEKYFDYKDTLLFLSSKAWMLFSWRIPK